MKNINDIDFLQFVGKQESQYLEIASTFKEDTHRIFDDGVINDGDTLPWKKTHDKFRLRSNEVTLWAGINGHGKSLVTSQVFSHLMKTKRCLIASLEMPISRTLHRMIKQIAGTGAPTYEYREEIFDWTDDRLWMYDQLDTVQPERILGMCIYAFQVLRLDHIIIDSLMKCGVPNKDTEKMQQFIDRLMWVAKTHGGHIHLVHHIRKGENEDTIPNKFDVKGAGEITDMVDNVCIVWKNKAKAAKLERGETINPIDVDGLIVVEKQRHGEWEGKFGLYIDRPSGQFKGSHSARVEIFDRWSKPIAAQS